MHFGIYSRVRKKTLIPYYSHKRAHTKEKIRKIPWDQFVWNELYNSRQTQGAGDLNQLFAHRRIYRCRNTINHKDSVFHILRFCRHNHSTLRHSEVILFWTAVVQTRKFSPIQQCNEQLKFFLKAHLKQSILNTVTNMNAPLN